MTDGVCRLLGEDKVMDGIGSIGGRTIESLRTKSVRMSS